MKRGTLLALIILASVAIGGLLYLYGGASFNPATYTSDKAKSGGSNAHFAILAEGQDTDGFDLQVNYRITDADQLAALWSMVYGDTGLGMPDVDFQKHEVLAVFDGSHSTGGYDIRVDDVEEVDGKRVLSITHIVPGESCAVTDSQTSPFVIIQVEKTSLALTHEDITETTVCP